MASVSNGQTGCCGKLAEPWTVRRTLTAMSPWRVSPSLDARAMVDYSLARRATLTALASGRRSPSEVCDAQTYLVRAARYHGLRVSFGYPACPDLADQATLWRLLRPDEIGIALTEGYMMDPEASVSALVFHHPAAKYFKATPD